MSYNNPNIPILDNPVGLDKVIQDIQVGLSTLEWLEKSFGRARTFSEKDINKKVSKIPKCRTEGGEYISVLPNDNFISQSFISAKAPEKYTDYSMVSNSVYKQRDLSVIFWFDMSKTCLETIEEMKLQVEKIFNQIPEIVSLNTYSDEGDDVFNGWTIDHADTQYFMWPFAGMRFEITVKYNNSLC